MANVDTGADSSGMHLDTNDYHGANLYDKNVTIDNLRKTEQISKDDEHTAGCIVSAS